MERLVKTGELKTRLTESLPLGRVISVKYNLELDLLTIRFVSILNIETVVHYLEDDEHIALLYSANTLEVVGLHIEDFTRWCMKQVLQRTENAV